MVKGEPWQNTAPVVFPAGVGREIGPSVFRMEWHHDGLSENKHPKMYS